MRISADTNILVRAVVADDKKHARAAARFLKGAELIAVTLPCLYEFVWVLHRVYKFGQENLSLPLKPCSRVCVRTRLCKSSPEGAT
jgi:predicted nucleic-acid-binding protein